jgi:uncharacterized protein
MAGCAAILHLLPFSLLETSKVNLLYGGFPEVLARPKARALWFSSYPQTCLERDVRAFTNARDLVTFRRFLPLLASRHGQVLNKTVSPGSAVWCFGAYGRRMAAHSGDDRASDRCAAVL